jgi:hypothetical protein
MSPSDHRLSHLWSLAKEELMQRDELRGQAVATVRAWFRDGPAIAWKLGSWKTMKTWPKYASLTQEKLAAMFACDRAQFGRIESQRTLSEGLFYFLQSAADRYAPPFETVPMAERRRQSWICALAYVRCKSEQRKSVEENISRV